MLLVSPIPFALYHKNIKILICCDWLIVYPDSRQHLWTGDHSGGVTLVRQVIRPSSGCLGAGQPSVVKSHHLGTDAAATLHKVWFFCRVVISWTGLGVTEGCRRAAIFLIGLMSFSSPGLMRIRTGPRRPKIPRPQARGAERECPNLQTHLQSSL